MYTLIPDIVTPCLPYSPGLHPAGSLEIKSKSTSAWSFAAAMAIQRCTRFATAFLLAELTMGHVAQITPMSRQVANSRLNGKIR